MIVVKLREAMERHRRQTGQRMTYRQLNALTGISESTLQSIAARRGYNPSLDLIDRIATALDCPLELLLEQVPNPVEKAGEDEPPGDVRQATMMERQHG